MHASEEMGFELEIELFVMGLVTRPWPHKHSKDVTTIFKSPKLLFCGKKKKIHNDLMHKGL